MKKILLAIPTAKYIETETFKSIYNLIIPDGYDVEFQYFYGYNIAQIRNLIAHWAINYDYLFSVDSDIILPPDTLQKMLRADRDMVSGVYIQDNPKAEILEAYKFNAHGGVENIRWNEVSTPNLYSVAACGFGCVLVKSWVIQKIGYPQFEYFSALDHKDTISEDVDFCAKARKVGAAIYLDSSIVCGHIKQTVRMPKINNIEMRLRDLSTQRLIPLPHYEYLMSISKTTQPKVIYDIGACVLHWTNMAKAYVWPNAQYVAFEAMDAAKFLYEEAKIPHAMAALSDQDGKVLDFYENTTHPGGNSYYKENPAVNPEAELYFNESHRVTKISRSLDSLVEEYKFPLPDMIKMDVQGAELDVLKGATNTLKTCQDLILELQNVDYNEGAPKRDEVIQYLQTIGFILKTPLFSRNGDIDGDYHFVRQ